MQRMSAAYLRLRGRHLITSSYVICDDE